MAAYSGRMASRPHSPASAVRAVLLKTRAPARSSLVDVYKWCGIKCDITCRRLQARPAPGVGTKSAPGVRGSARSSRQAHGLKCMASHGSSLPAGKWLHVDAAGARGIPAGASRAGGDARPPAPGGALPRGRPLLSLDEALASSKGAHVVISIPPDAGLDLSLSESLARTGPSRLVYLSSTGVYGGARGTWTRTRPWIRAPEPGPLEAEAKYRRLGGISLRIAGIYGPGRGLHERIRAGTLRIPETGGGRISRVHVDDLGEAIRVVLERGEPGATYCVADDRPATQAETAPGCPRGWDCRFHPRCPSLHCTSLSGATGPLQCPVEGAGWRPATRISSRVFPPSWVTVSGGSGVTGGREHGGSDVGHRCGSLLPPVWTDGAPALPLPPARRGAGRGRHA